jgi:hypothetical protein
MDYYGSKHLFQQLYNNKKTMVSTYMAFHLHVSARNGLFQEVVIKVKSSYGYFY